MRGDPRSDISCIETVRPVYRGRFFIRMLPGLLEIFSRATPIEGHRYSRDLRIGCRRQRTPGRVKALYRNPAALRRNDQALLQVKPIVNISTRMPLPEANPL